MRTDDPKPMPEEAPEISRMPRDAFDIRALETMPEDEADAE